MANNGAEKFEVDKRAAAATDGSSALIHHVERVAAAGASTGGAQDGLPDGVYNKLVQRMDQRHDDAKLNLPENELQALKKIEQSLLKGDTRTLVQTLQGFAAKPAQAEDMMNVVVSDLDSIGVQSSWDYSTKVKGKPFDPSFYQMGKEDVGNFSVYREAGDTVSSVTFTTEGAVSAVDSSFQNGNTERGKGTADPAATLNAFKRQWQKGW